MSISLVIGAALAAGGSVPVCLGSFQGVGLLVEQDVAVARLASALDALGFEMIVPKPDGKNCAGKPRIDFSIMRIGTILQVGVRVVPAAGDAAQELNLSIDSPIFPKRKLLASSLEPLRPLIAPSPPAAEPGPKAATSGDPRPAPPAASRSQPSAGQPRTEEIAAAPEVTAPPRAETKAPAAEAGSAIGVLPIALWCVAAATGIAAVALEADAVGQGNTAWRHYGAGNMLETDAANGRARTSEIAAAAFGLAATALAVGGFVALLTGGDAPRDAVAGAASPDAHLVAGFRY